MKHLLDVSNKIMFKDIVYDLNTILYNHCQEKWLIDVNRVEAKRGDGRNKLRTYKLFKENFETECYVYLNIRKKYRRAFALFRTGIAPINIELQRYGPNRKAEKDRKCIHCKEIVENECRVLTKFTCWLVQIST